MSELILCIRFNRSNPNTGHYTQMLWAGTTRLGCGAIRYDTSRPGTRGVIHYEYLVCNYGPAGNVLGRPVYISRNSRYRF